MLPIVREKRYGSAERCSMRICAWCLCSPASEGASWWRNALGSGRKLWLLAEPIDDGRLARRSRSPCRRFQLERHGSQRWMQCHLTGRLVKVPAETLVWSLVPGREDLSGLPHHEKPARSGSVKGWPIYPPCPMAAPRFVDRPKRSDMGTM